MPPPPAPAVPNRPKGISAFLRQPQPAPSSELTSDPFDPLSQSSPARAGSAAPTPRVLAVDLSPSVVRPIAFRVFTKKHNLTLKSDALQLLAQFIGRRCGAEWRDKGAGEKLLDEVARQWKRSEGAGKVLVDGGEALKNVLKGLEVPGGSTGVGKEKSPALSRSASGLSIVEDFPSSMLMGGEELGGGGGADVEMAEGDGIDTMDPREYFKIVDAFEQPKFVYNPTKKIFEKGSKPTLFPPPSSKTTLFRTRYNLLHSRLLRNDAFIAPTYQKTTSASTKICYKLTAISALLGRAGQSFLLFGMLSHSPAGALTLYDPTGEIPLDTTHTRPVPDASANFFCPGMFVLLEGIYEDSGTFTVFTIASPPPERRDVSAEIFGHVDFLGNGISLDMSTTTRSGGGQLGRVLRQTELSLSHVRWMALGELDLTSPRTLEALRHVFTRYESALTTPTPMLWILGGNFIPTPVYPSGEGSRTYKTAFDSLAALLDDFTRILSNSTWVFVPGDNDPWASTFSGGSSTAWPRSKMPEVFLNRVKRVITKGGGNVRCVSSPCRLGYFTSEVVLCRDDIVSRFRRNMVRFSQPPQEEMEVDGGDTETPAELEGGGKEAVEVDLDTALARKLVKTMLDQGSLSPFALNKRPVLWDFAYTVGLYPLPSAVILIDPTAQPFAVTYEGCHVCNPGRFVERRRARWVEFLPGEKRGVVIDEMF